MAKRRQAELRDGFRFFFYSNDHRPIHVHVRKGDGEAVFEIGEGVELRESVGLKLTELRRSRTWQKSIVSSYFGGGMSTLRDTPVSARHHAGKIHVVMESGLEISFPVRGNPRLEGKPEDELNHIELSPFGLHWPDLDEDLSIAGILSGNYGQRPHRAA